MRVGNNIDLARNQLLNARLQNLAVDPAGLTAADKGLIWIDAGGVIKFYDGDSVESLGVLGAGAPPSGPAGGDLTGAYPNPTIANGAVTSAKIADGTIVDGDIAVGAAIAKSKLAALSIVNADVAAGAAIAYSKLTLAGSITNADIAAGAAIAKSKLAALAIVNADVAAGAAIAQSKLALAVTDAEVAAGANISLAKLAVNPLARANHTGTQTAATISDFNAAAKAAMDKATIDALAVDAGTVDGFEGAALEKVANKNVANGYAGLGADGKLPDGLIPNLAISETFPVASQAAMLALAARRGDIAVRTDTNQTFILSGDDPTILANWTALVSPVDGVQSVTGSARISSTGGVNPTLDIVAGSIGAAQITDGAVGANEIADGSVTDAKIVSVSVAKVTGALHKMAATVGDGAATSIVVNHNLGTTDVVVSTRDAATGDGRLDDWKPTDANNVTLVFAVAPAANSVRVVVIG